MRITLYAKTCEFAGAALLAAALQRVSSGVVSLVYRFKVPYRFRDWFSDAVRVTHDPSRCVKNILRADWILLMGAPAVRSFQEDLPKHQAWKSRTRQSRYKLPATKRVACFATGARWHMEGTRARESCRRLYSRVGQVFFAMPNLLSLVDLTPIFPYLQPVIPVEVEKTDHMLLSHSPGAKLEEDSKGTASIVRVFERVCESHPGVRYEVLSGLSNQECIGARARSHIFVDQLPAPSLGVSGLGKSGLEAMACGCVTITSASSLICEPYFPAPPALVANTEEELLQRVTQLVEDPGAWSHYRELQLQWSRQYGSPEFIANYVLRILEEHS